MQVQAAPTGRFICLDRQYLIDDCRWINRYSNKKKSNCFPTKRYMHASVIHENFLYLFGGSEKHKNLENNKVNELVRQSCIFRLDFLDWEWQRLVRQPQPSNRDSFGSTSLKTGFVVFGGSDYETMYNDLWLFTYKTETWEELPQKNKLSPRDICNLVALNEQTLLLYGGMNITAIEVYNEMHIYDIPTATWTAIIIQNPPQLRLFSSLTLCGNQLFLFGGYGISTEQKYYNDIFKIEIKKDQKTAKMNLINAINKPPKRSAQGMCQLTQRYLLMIGGQGQKDEMNDDDQLSSKDDVWVFSTETYEWRQLFPKNASLRPRLGFSISRQGNNIYLFGGMKNYACLYDQLMILTFSEEKDAPKKEICSSCQKKIIECKPIKTEKKRQMIEESTSDLVPEISNSFVSSIASLQQFPLNAIGLIVDSAVLVKSQNIRIALKKRGLQLLYLSFEFDGQPLNNYDFTCFSSNKSSKVSELSNNIRLGSYRLGRTFVFVCRQRHLIKIILSSVNGSVVPGCDFAQRHIATIYNAQTNTFFTEGGQENFKNILNFMNTQVENALDMLTAGPSYSLYIFETIMVATYKKIYYELIPMGNDIQIMVHYRKIQFLEEIGYKVTEQPDISLASYLSILYKDPKIKMFINESDEPVVPLNYREHLKNLSNRGQLFAHATDPEPFGEVSELDVYSLAAEDSYPQRNLGLLIYHSGRLVLRYDAPLGSLFSQKFFRNRYKKKLRSIFKYLGVIEVNPQFMRPNMIKTDFENNQYNVELWVKLKFMVKELGVAHFRQDGITLRQESEDEPTKRKKPV